MKMQRGKQSGKTRGILLKLRNKRRSRKSTVTAQHVIRRSNSQDYEDRAAEVMRCDCGYKDQAAEVMSSSRFLPGTPRHSCSASLMGVRLKLQRKKAHGRV